MEKLTITGIWRNDRTSAGGKAYVSVSIKTREYGDKYVSGFGNAWNQNWKVGDTVEVDVTKKPGVDKAGKPTEYMNFSRPDPLALVTKTLMALSVDIIDIKRRVSVLEARVTHPAKEVEIPIIDTEAPLDFDESGAPIFNEPDLKPIPDSELPF